MSRAAYLARQERERLAREGRAPQAIEAASPIPTEGDGRNWRAVSLGGCSTVISSTEPVRSERTVVAYGHDASNGYCIGYPFREDDGYVRRDFVCFSHEDARLISAAPAMYKALKGAIGALEFSRDYHTDLGNEEQAYCQDKLDAALAALLQATGGEDVRR